MSFISRLAKLFQSSQSAPKPNVSSSAPAPALKSKASAPAPKPRTTAPVSKPRTISVSTPKPIAPSIPIVDSQAIVLKANAEAAEIKSAAQNQAAQIRLQAQKEAQDLRREADELKTNLLKQQADVERRLGALEEREKNLHAQSLEVAAKLKETEQIKVQQLAKLEKIAAITSEEARGFILDRTEKKLQAEISRRVKEAESEIKARADEVSKDILAEAMSRGATDYVAEYTVSTVRLEDEEMKGRIIGREGRNIRTFENAAGVEIELDETNDIRLSSFDPIRREIARRSLEKLIRDRRIQPARIEEIIEKTGQEMDRILFEEGEKLCREARVFRLPPELVKILGRFRFRFSHGQNLVIHTLEVVKIAVALAQEIKADVNTVKLAALFHDIGKVVTEQEGTHVELGVDLVKKFRLPPQVIACIAEHHEDLPFSSAESRILWIADAVSGARPGARYEPHEEYIKRMIEIEEIANSQKGVTKTYAYQAGRDLRVLVDPGQVSDNELSALTHKIKEELEKNANYAGQIKVTCIRELRSIENTHAK